MHEEYEKPVLEELGRLDETTATTDAQGIDLVFFLKHGHRGRIFS